MTANDQVPLSIRTSRVFRVLSQRSDCLVAALTPVGLITAMPAGVPVEGHEVLEGRSVMDFVMSGDHYTVADTFRRARWSGTASARVRLSSDPGRRVILRFSDLREEYGAFLAVLFPDDGEPDPTSSAAPIDAEVKAVVAEAMEFAKESPEPDPSELYTDVYLEAAQ